MSLPTTGTVTARIGSDHLSFDGSEWSGSDAFLVEMLNASTSQFTGTHIPADTAARRILAAVAGSNFEIISSEIDPDWPDIPDDSED